MSSLSRKYKKAKVMLQDAKRAFENLSQATSQHLIQEWTAQYETAMASRDDDPSAMDIYDVQVERGLSFIHHYVTLLILHLISHCVLSSTRKV